MRALIEPLIDYNYWANRRLLDAVEPVAAEVFSRDVGREFSFPTLQGMLVHIMGAELIWLARWQGISDPARERAESYPTVPALRARWEAAEREMRAFLAPRGDAELARALDYRAADGRPYRTPLWQMLQHVVNHGTHHRSEVATMLTRLGHPPPPTDLIVYYRTGGRG